MPTVSYTFLAGTNYPVFGYLATGDTSNPSSNQYYRGHTAPGGPVVGELDYLSYSLSSGTSVHHGTSWFPRGTYSGLVFASPPFVPSFGVYTLAFHQANSITSNYLDSAGTFNGQMYLQLR